MPPASPLSSISPTARRLLDTATEEIFDRFTRLATQVLGVPVSLISILDTDRQFFKSATGLPAPHTETRETPLTHSFCQHVVKTAAPLVVTDAREDQRVADNLAVRDLGVVAYAGYPVLDPEGSAIGALCAIETQPRQWTPRDLELLEAIAQNVTSEIVIRERLIQLGSDVALLRDSEKNRRMISRADRHDLRTPLNAMSLNLDAIREFGPLNEDQQGFLEASQRNMRTVLQMVDQLIDIGNVDSRGQDALHFSSTDTGTLIHAAMDQVRSLASVRGIDLCADNAAFFPLRADREKLERVLVNLLANGIKFTPVTGCVSVQVRYLADADAPTIAFTVRDTGIGIAEEHVSQIFAEGFRVDPEAPTRRSTGLGLTFCKRIVEAHGGRIWVESKLGYGTAFHFTLSAGG